MAAKALSQPPRRDNVDIGGAVGLRSKPGAQRRRNMADAVDVAVRPIDAAHEIVNGLPLSAGILQLQLQGIESVVDPVDMLKR